MTKTYHVRRGGEREVVALAQLDLEAGDGELLVVVGPSGSGKSTLLRCIAGLEAPDEGSIVIKHRDVSALPPSERDVAMVFQDFALYPHLTTFENIAFGLRARKVRGEGLRREVEAAVEILGLRRVLERKPAELSGGERQRVALARAIVRHPHVFLMDEPLSNLDAELRVRARTELRSLQRRLRVTTVYVTHDQTEAMAIADRVVVLRAGRVEQIARPADLYRSPATVFVARFIGSPGMSVVPDRVLGFDGTRLAGIRPEHVRLTPPAGARLDALVTAVEATGPDALVHLVTGGGEEIVARAASSTSVAEGDTAGVVFSDDDVHFFDPATGNAVS